MPPYTSPPTAMWVAAAPLCFAIACILTVSWAFRTPLHAACAAWLIRRSASRMQHPADASLTWYPSVLSPQQLLLCCLIILQVQMLLLTPWISLPWATLGSVLLMFVLVWLLLHLADMRYANRINAIMPYAANKYATYLGSGMASMTAWQSTVRDMPEHPLRDEWAWCLARIGGPTPSGGVITMHQVCIAMQAQTSSIRHQHWLGHLAASCVQPHDIGAARMQAASHALFQSEQRQHAAKTELSHMFYTGITLAAAGTLMTLALMILLWDRFVQAYTSPLGVLMGCVVVTALASPVVLGWWFSQVEDME